MRISVCLLEVLVTAAFLVALLHARKCKRKESEPCEVRKVALLLAYFCPITLEVPSPSKKVPSKYCKANSVKRL